MIFDVRTFIGDGGGDGSGGRKQGAECDQRWWKQPYIGGQQMWWIFI